MNRNTDARSNGLSRMEAAIFDRAHPPTPENPNAEVTRLGTATLLQAGNHILQAVACLTLSGEQAAAGRVRLSSELLTMELDVLRQSGALFNTPSDRATFSKQNESAKKVEEQILQFREWKRTSGQISAQMSAELSASSGPDVMPSKRGAGPVAIAKANREALAALSSAADEFAKASAEFDEARETRPAAFCRARAADLTAELQALRERLPTTAEDIGWLEDRRRAALAADVGVLAKGEGIG